jgi:hypothetical protein
MEDEIISRIVVEHSLNHLEFKRDEVIILKRKLEKMMSKNLSKKTKDYCLSHLLIVKRTLAEVENELKDAQYILDMLED